MRVFDHVVEREGLDDFFNGLRPICLAIDPSIFIGKSEPVTGPQLQAFSSRNNSFLNIGTPPNPLVEKGVSSFNAICPEKIKQLFLDTYVPRQYHFYT